jgi:hypothetical protein
MQQPCLFSSFANPKLLNHTQFLQQTFFPRKRIEPNNTRQIRVGTHSLLSLSISLSAIFFFAVSLLGVQEEKGFVRFLDLLLLAGAIVCSVIHEMMSQIWIQSRRIRHLQAAVFSPI